jgi:hypothetical protein
LIAQIAFEAASRLDFGFNPAAMKTLGLLFRPYARLLAVIGILLSCVGNLGAATTAPAAAATFTTEIEALLRYVSKLEGASFVRNGDAHTPKEAEEFLRLKWGQQKKEVRTAEDFIRLCATKSSTSGKPYSIKFKDGRQEDAAVTLSKQLTAIRTATAPN